MDRKEFQEFFKKNRGNFISGIYNYCDRWCERCEFTSKCSVYAMEEQREKPNEDNPNAFIEQVGENFKLVMEMLLEMAEEKGIDLNSIDDSEDEQEEKLLEEFADNHFLSVQSKEYSTLLRKWFDENETTLKNLSDSLNQNISLGLVDEKNLKEFDAIKDALEIIRWYSFQIHVKLVRALRHGELDLEYEDPVQNDVNGSAKVALIGTERSLGAWGVLHRTLPEQEDQILEILLLLEKIRKGIFKTFPDVNQFIRPGFDE
jgi:hypothetical protein